MSPFPARETLQLPLGIGLVTQQVSSAAVSPPASPENSTPKSYSIRVSLDFDVLGTTELLDAVNSETT